jgi:ubiquinone/menaquinone biosynthesis C-methylase UbiE
LKDQAYDLVLSVFTFDNIPTIEKKEVIFKEFGRLLDRGGRIIILVSAPEIYTHEWTSFTTRDFPENTHARSGDKVKIIMKDVQDKRPVEDILWTNEAYQEGFKRAGLEVLKKYTPLAKENEPYEWINETRIAPWVIYVIKKAEKDL